jgi:hypothetical protein
MHGVDFANCCKLPESKRGETVQRPMRDSASAALSGSQVQLLRAAARHAEALLASYSCEMAYEIARMNAAIERGGRYWLHVFRAVRKLGRQTERA